MVLLSALPWPWCREIQMSWSNPGEPFFVYPTLTPSKGACPWVLMLSRLPPAWLRLLPRSAHIWPTLGVQWMTLSLGPVRVSCEVDLRDETKPLQGGQWSQKRNTDARAICWKWAFFVWSTGKSRLPYQCFSKPWEPLDNPVTRPPYRAAGSETHVVGPRQPELSRSGWNHQEVPTC